MKRFFLVAILLFVMDLGAQSRFSELIEAEKKVFSARQGLYACAASGTYNVNYYCCYWNLDPASPAIAGSVTMHFQTLTAIDSLQMDASIALTVDSVKYHNVNTNFLQQNGDVLGIKFPTTIAAGIFDSVKVFYHGYPASSGMGSFAQGMHHGAEPIVWTLSEPYGAKDWWPCKQTLDDKADSIDMFITIPQGNKAASNGLLKQVISQGTNNIYHWKHKYPIATYLVGVAVTDYVEYTDSVSLTTGKLPVLYYTYPQDSAASRQTDSDLLAVLKYYDSLFVPYPFMKEKYGMAQFGWGGGMEHQTMTFIGSYAIDLLAHELSHHWYGDKITCGNWRELWLNEGFATYCTGLAMGRLFGPTAFRSWQEDVIGNVTSAPDGSVWVSDTVDQSRLFSGRLTYDKGGYLLHMLRWKCGDNAFFQALRNYQSDPLLAYAFARTTALQQHLENTSGLNLATFFNQWYYGEGYPSYQVIWNQDKNNQLKIILNQSTSHSSVPFFAMPVPIEVSGEGKDTVLVFDHTASGETFYTNLNFKVDTVVFDPDLHILSAQNKVIQEYEYLRSQMNLVIYPNPATTQLNIEVNDLTNYPQKVEMFDVLGQRVLESSIHSNKFSLDVSGLDQGNYLLRILSGSKASTYKIAIGRH